MMHMKINKIWIFQNCANHNGIIRNEYHFFAPNRSYLGWLLQPNNIPFSPDNQQLKDITHAYAEMLGIIPVSSSKNTKRKN